MQRIRLRQQGFTLAELVIAMALTVLLLAGIGTLLSVNVQSWLTGSSRTEVKQTARYAMDMMVRELRYAKTFTGSANSLNFIDVAPPNNQYRYYLNAYILYREPVSPSGTAQPVTGVNVSGSTNVVINRDGGALFTIIDDNTVLITLTATDTVRNESYTLRSVVYGSTKYLK